MAKVGIAIDNWKLSIFERHLSQAGYAFKWVPGLTKNTGLITVELERHAQAATLHPVIKAANDEAAKTGAPK
jgi:hypothetical protein